MKIGMIGAHIVGMRLAAEFARVGHDVLMTNSGGASSVREKLARIGSRAPIAPATMAEVLDCELVVLAAPWVKREAVLDAKHDWGNRILLDATNTYLSYPPHYQVDDLKGESGSEIIARLAPGARVVKAFNTLDFGVMFSPAPAGMRRVLFTAGDDASAVATVGGLIEAIGLHAVTVGTLARGGRLMELEAPLHLLELFVPLAGRAVA